jgi:putative redox protein
MSVELKRINKAFHYEAKDGEGRIIDLDSSPDIGGEGKGIRPMDLVLMGVGGCSSIDLGLILNKQRQTLDDYKVTVSGERNTDPGKSFKSIHIEFELWGEIDSEKLDKAIELTKNKYCSVIQSLNPAIEITTGYTINK